MSLLMLSATPGYYSIDIHTITYQALKFMSAFTKLQNNYGDTRFVDCMKAQRH